MSISDFRRRPGQIGRAEISTPLGGIATVETTTPAEVARLTPAHDKQPNIAPLTYTSDGAYLHLDFEY